MNISKILAISLMISMSFNSASFAMHDNIHEAAEAGDYGRVERILQANPGAVNARDKCQRTPLYSAAKWGIVDAAECLLEYGATVNARDKYQKTPLHIAAYWEHTDVVRLLLKHRAHVDARDDYGCSPLDIAEKWNGETAQLLRDWPYYNKYLSRQGQCIEHIMSREQALAFAMAMHPRLGVDSPAHVLDGTLCRKISMLLDPYPHSSKEIHQIAEEERRKSESFT